MASFLLLNSVGYNVYAHYCNDELKETSILVKTTESCCEEEESEATTQTSSCCAEDKVLVVIKDHFVKSDVGFSSLSQPIFYLNNHFSDLSFSCTIPQNQLNIGSIYDPPPQIIPDLNLLYSVFRI